MPVYSTFSGKRYGQELKGHNTKTILSVSGPPSTWFDKNMEGNNLSSSVPESGKIDRVIFVLQENIPFDRYFASFPGADANPKAPHVTKDRPWCAPIFEPTHG